MTKSTNAGVSRIKQPARPPLRYSFHDLDKRKTLLVTQMRLNAIMGRWTNEEYNKAVRKALKSLYVTHARATGNLNKYAGHDGTPGYRNPNYLWDHLQLGADSLPVVQGETNEVVVGEIGEHPLETALNAAESEREIEDNTKDQPSKE